MRFAFQGLLLLSLAAQTYARSVGFNNGVSPNGACELRVHETPRIHSITYDLAERATGRILLRIRSSYQPDGGERQDWAWDHAKDTEIHWSGSSHCLFIDEQVHNHIGELFVVAIHDHRASRVPLPEGAIMRKSGHEWKRYRIRVARGYEGRDNKITLTIAGRVESGKPGATLNCCFDFPVILRDCRVISIGNFEQVY